MTTVSTTIDVAKIPEALKERPQWVLWKHEDGTKKPYQINDLKAKAGDPSTWTTFEKAYGYFERCGYSGIGFEFAADDPFCGVDLDNCRNPETGEVAEWAREVITELDTYAEVSPSGGGVKLWMIGKSPFAKGRKRNLDVPAMTEGKKPAIEVYDHARYFAVTGWRMQGPTVPQERQAQLEAVCRRLIPSRKAQPVEAKPVVDRNGHGRLSVAERAERYVDAMPISVEGSGGSDQTFAVACVLAKGFALPYDDAYGILSRYSLRCEPPWIEAELRHKLGDAYQTDGPDGYLLNAPLNGRGGFGGQANTTTAALPEIIIGPDESRVVDQAIQALAGIEDVYQRGGSLVHIVSNATPPKCIERPEGSLRIVRVPEPRLGELLGDAADWFRMNKGSGGSFDKVPIHPPDRIVRKVEARGQWKGIPPIEAVVECPVLLANGSILTTPGFNADHGLYYSPATVFPEPIADPTRDDAEWAASVLLDVVSDVPFKSDEHRAAWLAAMLTPFARQAYAGPSPLIVVDANVAGAGKGLAVDVISRIYTGREIARTSNPRGDDEGRKLITSVALAGEPAVLIDNVSGRLGCPALDAALTATTWSDRILGRSETTGALPLTTIWFATANNLVLGADTTRRTLHIRLEYLGENPEERSDFKHADLAGWVIQERGRLAIAAVTILRAYHVAGRPSMNIPPWGSFEGWSGLVRSAVVYAGMPDPALTRQGLTEQSDSDAAVLRQLLNGWQELDPSGHGSTVADAFEQLKKHPEGYPKLRAALMEFHGAKDDKLPGRQSVGMKLHHWQRKVLDGRYFNRRFNRSSKTAIWEVLEVKSQGD